MNAVVPTEKLPKEEDNTITVTYTRSKPKRRPLPKQKNTGSLAPKSRIRTPYEMDNDELNAFIDKHPDAYLNEVAAHFQVTIPGVSIALKRLKITRKKESILERKRRFKATCLFN